MRVSSDRKPTKKPTAQTDQYEKKYDIRAGNQIKQWSMLEFNWLRSLFLIASDTLGLQQFQIQNLTALKPLHQEKFIILNISVNR